MKLQSARKVLFFLPAGLLSPSFIGSGLVSTAFAEGTRIWEQSKFEELTWGTATGIAIRSMGGLELRPPSRASTRRHPLTFGRLPPTMAGTCIWRRERPRGGTASRLKARRSAERRVGEE